MATTSTRSSESSPLRGKAKWSLDDVWPFDLETTALISVVAFFAYGVLLGYQMALETVK